MACTSCGQKRAALVLGATRAAYDAGDEDLVLILYTSPNVGMHNVLSPSGAIINGQKARYGRHKGASSEVVALYEAGDLSLEKARDLNVVPYSVFWVHPNDVELAPNLFKPLLRDEELVEAQSEEAEVEKVSDEPQVSAEQQLVDEALSFAVENSFSHKYLTEKVLANFSEAGMPVSGQFLAGADVELIASMFRKSGKVTAEAKAEAVIEAAKEFVGE